MAKISSETDYVFRVVLEDSEVAQLKSHASAGGKRYVDYAIDIMMDYITQLFQDSNY